ncbi:g13071 [Coccomyxa viridis]|uniref:G13071 protein n=1 Tax=Coccomyxa viridis TaxID=1274662 RepID=A0ABP1GBW6_9CHLO
MGDVTKEKVTESAINPISTEKREERSSEELIDRLQSKVQQYVRGADQTVLEQMRLTVFEVVVGVLRSKEFMNDIPKAVETACKAAAPLLKEISKNKPAAQEELFEDPEELDQSTPRSRSLMEQAAEGVRALGSFFAQAAMGGAEVSTLVREEEEGYHAEDIVYPLRRLAANEPGLDDTLVRQSSMYAGSLAGLSPGSSMELPWKVEGGSAEGGDASALGGSMKGGDPALMGGHTEPTTEGAEYAQGAQDRAKAGRDAQQRQLAAKTGDTLYPASDVKEDDGRDGGSFASAGSQYGTDAANVEHITGRPASTHLQEENWDAPAQQATAAPVDAPTDVKSSRGVGNAAVPRAS